MIYSYNDNTEEQCTMNDHCYQLFEHELQPVHRLNNEHIPLPFYRIFFPEIQPTVITIRNSIV